MMAEATEVDQLLHSGCSSDQLLSRVARNCDVDTLRLLLEGVGVDQVCKYGVGIDDSLITPLQHVCKSNKSRNRWRVLKNWALKPGVLRVGELVDVGSGMCAWRCRRLRAAPGDRCRADAACKFLARAPIKGAALLWFGDTRLINTPVHAADERRVECSLAHEQSGVGGGAVLELFDG